MIISEYAPSIRAKSEYFLQRNRIISGISIGILIIEAKFRSGTSVTAKLASQQGKKVFALPHNIEEINGIGTNRIIKNGGLLVTCTKDIIDEFEFLEYKEIISQKNSVQIKENNKDIKFENKEYQTIYNLISEKTMSINEIYREQNIELSKLSNILFMLELDGYIEKIPGGYRCTLNMS